MLIYSVIILAIAAVGGLLLATKVLSGKQASWPISLAHAGLGATGLILLLLPVLGGTALPRSTLALALLVVAALGGFFLASFHVRKVIAPKSVVIIHAGVAVAGFLTLVSILLGM